MARSTGRRLALGAAMALLALAAACERAERLGPDCTVEDVVADVGATIASAGALVDPGDALRGDGARTALVTAPGTRLVTRVAVPERAALRFGVGVEGQKARDASKTGVRFSLTVDGRPLFMRTVNPAADRRDRRWFDERVDLAAFAGHEVELGLAAEADAPDRPLAGTAAWSRLRLVRSSTRARQTAAAERPNLLVLVVDTLRADAIGLYGAGAAATPVLDALGARGTVFKTAVSQSSWTLPSVASMLTGLAPRTHGAVGDVERADGGGHARWGYLSDAVPTWVQLAGHAGITTFGASANPLVSVGTNLAKGFETFVELPWDPEGRNWASADDVNAAFLAWLPRAHGYRFVAALHYMEPHDPYTPPDPPTPPAGVRDAIAAGWVRDAANRVNWGRGEGLTPAEIAHLRRRYDGEVHAWDAALGRLLAALAAAGHADDTIVVVTADHGEEFQEHGRLTHGSHLYEESIRVPLVLAGPGIPARRRTDLAQGIDQFPTVARLLGLGAPSHLRGRDLLADEQDRPAVIETTSGIAPDGSPIEVVAIRTSAWKVLQTPRLARTEVYDLTADPRETNDRTVAADGAAALVAALERWRAETPAADRSGTADPAFAARLRALGYAE